MVFRGRNIFFVFTFISDLLDLSIIPTLSTEKDIILGNMTVFLLSFSYLPYFMESIPKMSFIPTDFSSHSDNLKILI